MKRFLFILVLALVFASAAMAQDAPSCDVNQLATDITVQIAEMEADPVTSLLAIMQIAMSGASECGGNSYHFSSEDKGRQTVIGPVSFGVGVFVATLTTDNIGIVSAQTLNDNCGYDVELFSIAVFDDSAKAGAKTVMEVEAECQVLFQFNSMQSDWTFDIEKVG